jgi:hypothetical protein
VPTVVSAVSNPNTLGDSVNKPASPLYAVIGRSEGQPVLYHMNQPQKSAEQLRNRRAQATGQPCYIVPMADCLAGPLTALQRAESEVNGA